MFPLGVQLVSVVLKENAFFKVAKHCFSNHYCSMTHTVSNIALINRALSFSFCCLLTLFKRYPLALKVKFGIWVLLMLKPALHFLLSISRFICVQKEKKQISCLPQSRLQQIPFDLSTPPIFSIQYLHCVLLFSLFLRESVSMLYVKKLCSEATGSSARS